MNIDNIVFFPFFAKVESVTILSVPSYPEIEYDGIKDTTG